MKTVYKRIIIIFILFSLILVFSGILLYNTYQGLGREMIRRTALLIGDSVSEILANAADRDLESLTPHEKSSLRRLMRSLTSEEGNIIHILLISDKMRILLSSDRSVEGREYTSPEELKNLQGNAPKVIRKTWNDSVRVVDVILPLMREKNAVHGYLRLVLSQKEIQNVFGDIFYLFVPLGLVMALLIGFSIYLVSRAYTKPLETIETMAENIAQGDYSYRINYEGQDEFTDTFSRIDASLEKVNVMQASYKKTERRINALMQAVDESIILLDAKRAVSDYNEVAVDLFQCPVEMLFESHFQQIIAMNKELDELIARSFEREENVFGHELNLWLPDGRHVLSRVTTFILHDENQVSGMLLTIKDQKLLNELQNNLQRSMKFGVIASLASSISHEIKNPLSSMAIHAEILHMRLEEMELENKEAIDKSLNVLQNEVKRLNRIINQFFNLARVKKTDLNAIHINTVLEDVITLVHQQAIERNIKIEKALDPAVERIYGDPDQLKQVFLNIVLNAFQAIHNTGTVRIATRMDAGQLLVEIEDDGCGMPPEVQERLFELYFTTKHDGGGIGMAICRNIVEAHEGQIDFKSVEKKGTTFYIRLPRMSQTTQINIAALRRPSLSSSGTAR
ncbi:MAG: HAMP domain-containing protein [Calditrichaeota bacterium]|nr:MAG: HAMP domain-containing protein [Calditrichota bacterium]